MASRFPVQKTGYPGLGACGKSVQGGCSTTGGTPGLQPGVTRCEQLMEINCSEDEVRCVQVGDIETLEENCPSAFD